MVERRGKDFSNRSFLLPLSIGGRSSMAYTTLVKVKDNHERLPKQDADLDTIISTMYIPWADAIIDAHIAMKYSLPLTTAPPLLEWISTSLSTCFALKRVTGAQINEEYYEWIKDYWDTPMELLRMIRDCDLQIGAAINDAKDMVNSSTYKKQPIFDLGEVYDQAYHPDTDRRYGLGYK